MKHPMHVIFEASQAHRFMKHTNHAIFWSMPSMPFHKARQSRKDAKSESTRARKSR